MDDQLLPKHHVLCIDMRSFYASVEAVRLGFDPMDVLLAVVGDTTRPGSIVLAASPALKRKHGIQNVSRFFELPYDSNIHIVQANMAQYLYVSVQITKLLYNFGPKEAIHPYSIDEVWMTVNGLHSLHGHTIHIAKQIQIAIKEQFGITSAVGIGPNKFLAKVVLDLHAKKASNGIAVCRYEDVPELLWPTPVGDMWGVGSRLQKRLHHLGITTVKQLANYSLTTLKKHFGIMGEQLYWHAWGIDLSPVYGNFMKEKQDSYGHGITLLRNYTKNEALICILELCEEACRRARTDRKAGKTIQLSIQYDKATRSGFSRSKTVEQATNITREMFAVCTQLFEQFYDGMSLIRRISVTLTNLIDDNDTQLHLFNERQKWKDIGYAMDNVRAKYGTTALLRASSYTNAGIMLERGKKIGGHWAQS